MDSESGSKTLHCRAASSFHYFTFTTCDHSRTFTLIGGVDCRVMKANNLPEGSGINSNDRSVNKFAVCYSDYIVKMAIINIFIITMSKKDSVTVMNYQLNLQSGFTANSRQTQLATS